MHSFSAAGLLQNLWIKTVLQQYRASKILKLEISHGLSTGNTSVQNAQYSIRFFNILSCFFKEIWPAPIIE